MALYESTNGGTWYRNDSWLTDTPHCNWWGVTCNTDGRVEELRLWMKDLSGPIPPELGNLGNLVYLYLDSNDPSLCVSTQELLGFSTKLPQCYGPTDLCPPP